MLAYVGTPDVVFLADLEKSEIEGKEIYYDETACISFGYFQTSLDGDKEFRFSDTKEHKEMSEDAAKELVGKAIGNEYVREALPSIETEIYKLVAFHGRIFTEQKVVTTWYKMSVKRLTEILNQLGGVEKFKDFMYCYEDQGWKEIYTVGRYLKSGYSDDDARYELALRLRIQDCGDISESVLSLIRAYNSPSDKMAQLTSKLPKGMTIAQYHSLFPEAKESKKVIKENKIIMDKKDKKEFMNYIKIITEALNRENYDAYDAAVEMLNEAINESRHQKELEKQLDTTNFGVLNHIFESRLPELFKTNKMAVKKVMKLIKEDQNLSSEFKFYDTIRKYKGNITETIDPATLLAKFNDTAETYKFIDKDTIIESNKKFRKVLKENNIVPTEFLTEEEKNLYNAGHIVLTKKKSLNNVVTLTESFNSLAKYMDSHKNDIVKENVDPSKVIREFEEKLKDTLTESEMSFVQQITDWRSPLAEQRKEKLFNKFKNECIDKVNDMLKEDAGNVELEALKKQLEEQKFNKDSIVKDIAKLLEIRDILLDK